MGEKPDFSGAKVFEIVKGGSPKEADGSETIDNKIDAITGATMTSNGLTDAINVWFAAYAKYFQGAAPAEKACCDENCEGNCEEGEACENKEVEE